MNRMALIAHTFRIYVPRRRGDEPQIIDPRAFFFGMFPAGAGMNRQHTLRQYLLTYVPRRRGDEPPLHLRPHHTRRCSPQARG